MDTVSRDLLEERIEASFSEFDEATGEKRKAIMEDIKELYKLKIEEDKADLDYDDKYNRRLMEHDHFETECKIKEKELKLKEKQNRDQKILGWITAGVTLGNLLIGVFAYNKWDKRHLFFEEHGTQTTPEGKNLTAKMLPKIW